MFDFFFFIFYLKDRVDERVGGEVGDVENSGLNDIDQVYGGGEGIVWWEN